jgi:hypothetical protein
MQHQETPQSRPTAAHQQNPVRSPRSLLGSARIGRVGSVLCRATKSPRIQGTFGLKERIVVTEFWLAEPVADFEARSKLLWRKNVFRLKSGAHARRDFTPH